MKKCHVERKMQQGVWSPKTSERLKQQAISLFRKTVDGMKRATE